MKRLISGKNLIIHLILVFVSITCIYPFLWIIANTFKTNAEIIKRENLLEVLIPKHPMLNNYYEVFLVSGFGRYILNTLIYTVVSVSIGIVLGVLCSYALAFHKFPSRKLIYVCIVMFMMIPMPGIFIPQYLVIGKMGLMNSALGVILPSAAGILPLSVFLIKGYMDGFSVEIIEAATIDGCNKWSKCWRIVTPMTKPAIATLAVLHSRGVWNSWLLPSLILTNDKLHTIQTGLMKFQSEHYIDYALTMTGLAVSMMPLLVIFLLLQKFVINGISAGAIKG